MTLGYFITVAIALSLIVVDARPGASGNNNPAATGSTYLIEGQRNELASSLTSDAISKAVTSGKAFMASAVGGKAALSAADRSVHLRSFDELNSGGRKMLASGRASGNNNAAATGSTYQIEGQRNDLASSLTSDVIAEAVASGKAFRASAVGNKAVLSAADRSVSLKTFDRLNGSGNRKLQQNRDRGDMVAFALQTARASIERAVSSSKLATDVKSAATKNMEVARLSNKQSARSADFTDGRRLLQHTVNQVVTTSSSSSAAADQLAEITTKMSATSKTLSELHKELTDMRKMYTQELRTSNM